MVRLACVGMVGALMVCSAGAEVMTSARVLDLSGKWTLRQEDDPGQPAVEMAVPGGVHTALLAAGRIPDPFFGQNEKAVQWVGQKDWRVERRFTVPADLLACRSITLRLEHVDTFCTLSINGQVVGETGNRFRRYDFEVKPYLREGANTISALFRSSEKESEERARTLTREIPIVDNGIVPHINLIRKPACHGGWDWGLALMMTGFAGKVELLGADLARMDYVTCDQKHEYGRCGVTVHTVVTSPAGGETELTVKLGDIVRRESVTLQPGVNTFSTELTVLRPNLWWPNGAGEQYLYPLEVTVGEASLKRKLGLRTIEVVNQPDRDGISMTFRVNGVNLFCKGANWIPCDAFMNRQTDERYADLLNAAVQANMNMLRLWGGGQFEADRFYELCDELGLMIWHDFMFSCSLYPADKAFLAEVKAELTHQIRRLRDHASIAIWCGDNECIGALTWFEPSRKNRDVYLIAYDRLNRMLTETVEELDPVRTFWPSSPCGGPGDFSDAWHDDNKGDMHNWTVWHENKDFSAYYNYKPRFCSEFGYQSFPSREVALTFCKEEDLNPTSPDFEYHQKNKGGNTRILETMSRYFRFPEGTENILYLSQVQQAMAIKTAVEGWRRLQPRCMGTLIWQLNDNWPISSWSTIEYGGKWKHLHYHAKRFFAPLAVVAVPADNNRRVEVWAINDHHESVYAETEVVTWTFDGKKGDPRILSAQLPAHSATLVQSYWVDEFGSETERLDRFLALTLRAQFKGETVTFKNEWLFNPYKRCSLGNARVDAIPSVRDGKWTVVLTTDKPAFFVWADTPHIPGTFSDNSFTLYPGQPVRLTFTPKGDTTFDAFKSALTVKHLRQTYR